MMSAASDRQPRRERVGRLVIAMGLAFALVEISTSLHAQAASPDRQSRSSNRLTSAQTEMKAAAFKPADRPPLLAIISLADQRMTLHAGGAQIAETSISSGQSGHRTPTGLFSIIQKNRHHESNIYSGAPMPFMQRLTWSGIALHEGVVPGYPASHGCIRLPGAFAQQLWGMTKLGVRVVVAPHRTAPTSISHPALPTPRFAPVDATQTVSSNPATGPALGMVPGVALISSAQAAPISSATLAMQSPFEFARTLKATSTRRAADAAKVAQTAFGVAATQASEANAALARKQTAAAKLARLRAQIAHAERAFDDARTPEAADAANLLGLDAFDQLDVAAHELEIATDDDATQGSAALSAAQAARVADHARDDAEATLQDANRRSEPVNVLISRKERMVFVRQGFTPIFEAPITIRDADDSIGTHLYMVNGTTASDTDISWIAVTVPETAAATDTPVRARQSSVAPRPSRHRDTAASALDRIEWSDDARRFVAERLWVGASLTISDYGISTETGKGTDFVVLTK
jgi:hypothetical protein